MEYPYSKLEDAIVFFFTLHKEEQFTKEQLFDGLIANNICPELSSKYIVQGNFWNDFTAKCESTVVKFDNIHKNGLYYYYEKSHTHKSDVKTIRKFLEDPSSYVDITLGAPYANGQSILHILCIMCEHELLDGLCKLYVVDLHTKNESGQTLFDVIPNTTEGFKTFKVLLGVFLTQETIRHEVQNTLLKTTNTSLLEKNKAMRLEIIKLTRLNLELSTCTANLHVQLSNSNQRCFVTFLFLASLIVALVGVGLMYTFN